MFFRVWKKAFLFLILGGFALGGFANSSDAQVVKAGDKQPKSEQSVDPRKVPGLLTPLVRRKGKQSKGLVVFRDPAKGNCFACHKISGLKKIPFQGTLGPSLDGVAKRFTEAQLRQLVADASVIYPLTLMPPYYLKKGLNRVGAAYKEKTILSGQEIEDIVAFLKTLD